MWHTVEAYVKEHNSEQIKQADNHRLVKQARAGKPKMSDRLVKEIGSLLIAAGEQLQAPQQAEKLGWADK